MKSTSRLYAWCSIAFCVAWRLAAFPIAAFVSAPARFFDLVVTALPFIWIAPIGVMKPVAFKVIGWLKPAYRESYATHGLSLKDLRGYC